MAAGRRPLGPGRWGPAALFMLALSACSSYGDWARQMEEGIAAGNYQAAREVLESQGGNARDEVLYALDRALLLRMAGDFQASNAAFEQAKELMDELSAVSISEQARAATINDLQRSYAGEDYERVLVHVFSALNYLALGQPAEARVEVLQLDVLLGRVPEEAAAGGAFGRYFSGMVFEVLGEPDQALVAYRKADEAYRAYPAGGWVPRQLQADLARLERALGLADGGAAPGSFAAPAPRGPGGGEVILLLFSGLAPVKEETHITAFTDEEELVTLAVPELVMRPPHVRRGVLGAGEAETETEPVADIAVLARESLRRQMPYIMARGLARVVLKHEAVEKAGEESEGLGFLVNVAGVISERADTRSWSILPGQVYLARLPLAPGEHVLRLRLESAAGEVVETRRLPLTLAPGERRLVALHWVDHHDLWQGEDDQ